MDPIIILHLLTPALLSIPLLRLLPAAPPDTPELPGIRPITVRIITPRRSFILLVLSLLAFSSALDAARLVAKIATANSRGHLHPQGLSLWSEVVYAFGGLCVWALTAIVIEWRAKWGNAGLVGMGLLGLACEIPGLVLLVIRQVERESASG